MIIYIYTFLFRSSCFLADTSNVSSHRKPVFDPQRWSFCSDQQRAATRLRREFLFSSSDQSPTTQSLLLHHQRWREAEKKVWKQQILSENVKSPTNYCSGASGASSSVSAGGAVSVQSPISEKYQENITSLQQRSMREIIEKY